MVSLAAAFLLVMGLAGNVFADDKMYKCDDGTFTNRTDLHCPLYEPHGSVIVIHKGVVVDTRTENKVMKTPAPVPSHGKVTTQRSK